MKGTQNILNKIHWKWKENNRKRNNANEVQCKTTGLLKFLRQEKKPCLILGTKSIAEVLRERE